MRIRPLRAAHLRAPRAALAALGLAAVAAPGRAAADGMGPHPFHLEVGGYGELGFAFYDHGANQNRDGGAQDDVRLEFDTTRFVAELEGTMPGDLEFEAEVEFEHGGTGGAREIEYEEFGEFENEVEKGGEVIVEELYLKKSFRPGFGQVDVALGRFYVAMGHLSYRYRPTEYLGAIRSEAETTLLPAQWDEMGAQVVVHLPLVRLTGQVVNGLDSAGFDSATWISSGHQGAFELTRATDLAAVARADVSVADGVELGASGYVGNTSRNRPKADLVKECDDPDADAVAPCGYLSAPLVLVDLHAAWDVAGFRGQALGIWGRLKNADDISARNSRLSNEAGVARTPVADQAYGLLAEVGYDLGPLVGVDPAHAIEPYLRVERFDTMARVRTDLFDNPRFERTIVGVGASYVYREGLVAKVEASQRRFGSASIRPETAIRFMTGFVY